MSLRPSSANWFELLVMRDDLAVAMKVLASSRRVELQSHGEGRAPMLMPECRELWEEFDELERLYRDVRCGGFHPANAALAHEVAGKTALGIDLSELPRWG